MNMYISLLSQCESFTQLCSPHIIIFLISMQSTHYKENQPYIQYFRYLPLVDVFLVLADMLADMLRYRFSLAGMHRSQMQNQPKEIEYQYFFQSNSQLKNNNLDAVDLVQVQHKFLYKSLLDSQFTGNEYIYCHNSKLKNPNQLIAFLCGLVYP